MVGRNSGSSASPLSDEERKRLFRIARDRGNRFMVSAVDGRFFVACDCEAEPMSDLEFKATVKQVLRKLAEAIEEHIESANNPYALMRIREAQELLEEI